MKFDNETKIQSFVLLNKLSGAEIKSVELPFNLVALRSSTVNSVIMNSTSNKYYFLTVDSASQENILVEIDIEKGILSDTTIYPSNYFISELNVNSLGQFIGLQNLNREQLNLFIGSPGVSAEITTNVNDFLVTQAGIDNSQDLFFLSNANNKTIDAYDSKIGNIKYSIDNFPSDLFNMTTDNNGRIYGIIDNSIVRFNNNGD